MASSTFLEMVLRLVWTGVRDRQWRPETLLTRNNLSNESRALQSGRSFLNRAPRKNLEDNHEPLQLWSYANDKWLGTALSIKVASNPD
jgi:hypothetical protein